MNRGQTTLDFAVGVSIFLVVVAFVLAFVPGMVEPFESSTQQETAAANRLAENLATEVLVEDIDTPYVIDRECTAIFFESRQDGNDPGGDDNENVDGDNSFTDPYPAEPFSGNCNFNDTSLRDRITLKQPLNIRIRLVADLSVGELDSPDDDSDDDFDTGDPDDNESDTLCIDENSGNRIVEAGDPFNSGTECDIVSGDDDIAFLLGGTPPASGSSVTSARRAVHVEGGFGDGNAGAILIVEVW